METSCGKRMAVGEKDRSGGEIRKTLGGDEKGEELKVG